MPDIPIRVNVSVSESVQHYSIGVANERQEVPIVVNSTTNAVDIGVTELSQEIPIETAETPISLNIGIATEIVAGNVQNYDGQTEFTPTSQTQIAPTHGKRVLQDIVINPIPHNYGLITYNGQFITVS